MANPHYLPAIFIQVNIINFTVTFDGLQEQLLSAVVKQVNTSLDESPAAIQTQGWHLELSVRFCFKFPSSITAESEIFKDLSCMS